MTNNKSNNAFIRQGYLDGEKLFTVYWKMGEARSTFRLQRWCIENNMVNPKTQTTNRMGLWKAMWRWANRNPEKALKIYQVSYPDCTRQEFDTVLITAGKSAFQTRNSRDIYYASN